MAKTKNKKLILIDGNALMHRAYHALPPLTTKKGEVVNAVYGFTSVLLKVIKELKPDYMIAAFDVAGGTFRDKIFDKYKAGRVKPDQEFYDQIPKIKDVVRVLNIPIVEKKGFEADDIIGTLAKQASKEKLETIIVTGDLDVLQLIDDDTKVYTLRKGIKDTVVYDKKAVDERYGLAPGQIIDFKGLRGDPSDNIPGVKGIGEKGAIDLLKKFGSMEKIYEALEKGKTDELIKPKVKEKLVMQKNEALMSKELATIKKDVDVELDLAKAVWGDYDKNELNKLFKELEFYSLIERVEDANHLEKSERPKEKTARAGNMRCILVEDETEFSRFLADIKKQKIVALKTEREDGKPDDILISIYFYFGKDAIYKIPIKKSERKLDLFSNPDGGSFGDLDALKPFLEDPDLKKIGFFMKPDIEILLKNGMKINGIYFDSRIAAYLLDPGKRDYGEDKIIFSYLESAPSNEIIFEKKGKKEKADSKEMANFGVSFELMEKMESELKKAEMGDLFHKIDMPLLKILSKMEARGVKIDSVILKNLAKEVEEKVTKLSAKIHKLSGDDAFNINSSQQLSEILFGKMKLPTAEIKKTQTGFSVASTELEKLRDKHIIIDFISQYKELTKLKNTYIDALPKLVSKSTKRLHTTFNQDVTSTGRLSSSDPNLQNIPIRTEEGRRIRRAFIAETQRKLVSCDYSQIELRIIAMIADDKIMKDIFNKGFDIHSATAAEVNEVPIDKVTPEMRRSAKALNFGVIYGMSVYGFSQSAGIDRDKAKKFIDNYMKRFSAVARYIEESKASAREKGYAETLWGRRRYLPELRSSNAIVKNAAERMAINMPIQGTAADIIKIAMIKLDKWIEDYNKKNEDAAWMLLQVHDELVFSIKNENVDDACMNIKRIMENGHLELDGKKIDFPVPIEVDVKVGDNWQEMEER